MKKIGKKKRRETTDAEKYICPLDIKHGGWTELTDEAGDDGDYLSV